MAKRRAERVKRRVTCELVLGPRAYRGIVLDLSETGVFVQTEAIPGPGDRVRVRFHAPDGTEFEVEALVARRQVAPPQLASVVRGGLGLRVESPPEAYFRLIGVTASGSSRPRAEIGAARRSQPAAGRSSGPRAAAEPEPGQPFRVRVKQSDGPRSRSLTVRAASPEDARKRALAELGRGWEILSVEAA